MKKIILLIIVIISNCANSQVPRLHFNYDSAGNQTKRYLKLNSLFEKNSNEIFKETIELEDEDLLKFYDEDVLSYYPNPVKEQLFLKWDLINNKVLNISVFSYTGQQLKMIENLENTNSTSLSFSELPVGSYLVYLNYSNGKKESITILKN